MLENLRAKALKEKNLTGNTFELEKNKPIQICKNNNSHIAHLYEEKENEECNIHSTFNDESFAIICKEFYLNFYDDPKKADLSYYYFSEQGKAIVYLYDLKKTFAGIDVLIHLVEQWKSSIIDAKYCVDKTEKWTLDCVADIHLGVITEDDDVDRRKRELEPILHPAPTSDKLPSYILKQHYADNADKIAQAKILAGLDEGKVSIGGIAYEYDLRTFNDKHHSMHFIDGCLEAQMEE